MRRVLWVAALLATTAGLPHAAHASTYLHCEGFHQEIGDAGTNPPVSATVAHDDNNRWSIVYVLRDGKTVIRENQFSIRDSSTATTLSWQGWRNSKADKYISASIRDDGARLGYSETLYNASNKVLGHNWMDCGPGVIHPATTPATYTAPASPVDPSPAALQGEPVYPAAPAHASQVSIATADLDGVIGLQTVGVTLGTTYVTMQIDTGCSTMLLQKSVADGLIARGEATEAGTGRSVLADGSEHITRYIVINSINIGGKTLSNVQAGVGADDKASPLLGIGTLNRFGRFTIDTTGHQLVLG
jgi:hypothetical protein